MKILMVSRWLWEERQRGDGRPGFFEELARAVVDQGVDLTILSQADDAPLVPEARSVDGLNLHVFSREKRKASLWALDKAVKSWAGYRKAATDASVIRRFVRDHGPFDAIVAQCEEPDGLACALASFRGQLPPLVTFVHDLRYRFRPLGVRFIRKSSFHFIFSKSARVVANSGQTAEWLRSEYDVPGDKIGQCRIHLTAPFLAMAAPTSAVPEPEKRILFLGALNRKKAPDVFLLAAAEATTSLSDWKFVVVGGETSEDAPFHERLGQLAAHAALAGRIEMPGKLPPGEVIQQIRRARLVVCPSRIETFSRTTIEALALGRPVIVSGTTGAASWVQSTGCGSVVPPDDSHALAEAMLDWTKRAIPAGASAAVTSQLTAPLAAQDFVREVNAALGR